MVQPSKGFLTTVSPKSLSAKEARWGESISNGMSPKPSAKELVIMLLHGEVNYCPAVVDEHVFLFFVWKIMDQIK